MEGARFSSRLLRSPENSDDDSVGVRMSATVTVVRPCSSFCRIALTSLYLSNKDHEGPEGITQLKRSPTSTTPSLISRDAKIEKNEIRRNEKDKGKKRGQRRRGRGGLQRGMGRVPPVFALDGRAIGGVADLVALLQLQLARKAIELLLEVDLLALELLDV